MSNSVSCNPMPASRRARTIAWVPILVLIVLVCLFIDRKTGWVFDPPWLLFLLNTVFLGLIPAVMAGVTIKAYLGSGSMGLLGLSSGAFLMGVSAMVTGLLIGGGDGPNRAVTFYNMGFFLAGAFHCAGAAVVLTGIEPEPNPKRRRSMIGGLYVGMVAFMGLWLIALFNDLTPVFFIEGAGPTLLRQVILGGAVGLFLVSAGLMGLLYLRSRSRFQFWYGLGLLLIGVGLFCVWLPSTLGGPMGWLGRSAQYLGAVYLLGAVASAFREIRARGGMLGEGISALFQHRLEKLVAERTRELTRINERLTGEVSERKRVEEALQKAHDELEQRVTERTAALNQEVKEREKAGKALRETHVRYRGIVDHGLIGIAVYQSVDNGEDFVFIEFNPAAERIEQIDRKEVIGRRVTEVFPAIREFGLLEVFQRVWRTGATEIHPVSIYEDERIVGWRENYVYKLPTGEVVAVYRDETERKKAEEALRESEEKYRALVENAGEIVLVAQDNQVRFVNQRISDIAGYLPEEVIGKPFAEYIHPDDRETVGQRHAQRLGGETVPGIYPFRIVTKAAGVRWVESNIVLIRWEGRPATLNFLADITERRDAEEASRKWQAQLHQAQRMESIGILAGGVAHDFNNLLTTIMGNAQLALADLPKDDPLREDLQEIRKAGERGAMLTRQLLTFSRRAPAETDVLDLNEVVHDMDRLLRRLVRESIEVRTILAPGLEKVRADVGEIEQVIMNLVVNARDVMPEGGTLTLETANVKLDEAFFHAHDVEGAAGMYVMLSVSDTGPGMDKAIQDRIFEPFFTTKGPGAGTGLGLSTVYGIVKQAGGYIWPYSQPGMGTTMKVYLPRAEEAALSDRQQKPDLTARAKGQVVVVAEDDASIRDLTVKALQKAGYKVLAAGNGEEALRIIERFQDPIHLLLTDMVMPWMGGKELAERVQKLRPGIKVLYMSGFPERDSTLGDTVQSKAAFLQKPFTFDALNRRVSDMLKAQDSGR